MKKFLIFSSLYWTIIFIIVFLLKSGKPYSVFYYHGEVNSIYNLLIDFLLQKTSNGIFQWACDCLQYFGTIWGYSYMEMNFVVFVIIQPALILYFLSTTLFLIKKSNLK